MTNTILQHVESAGSGTTTRTVTFTPLASGASETLMVFVFFSRSGGAITLNTVSTTSSLITGWTRQLSVTTALATNGHLEIWTAQAQSLALTSTAFAFSSSPTNFDTLYCEAQTDLLSPSWSFISSGSVTNTSAVATQPATSSAIAGNAGDFYAANYVENGSPTLTAGGTPIAGFTYLPLPDGLILAANAGVAGPWQPSFASSPSAAYGAWAGVMRASGTVPTAPQPIPFISGYSGMFYHERFKNAYRIGARRRSALDRKLQPAEQRPSCGLRRLDRSGLRWGERRGGVRIG